MTNQTETAVLAAAAAAEANGNVPTPTTEPRRDWCCGTPMTKPHTPGCSYEPREDNPVDYTGPAIVTQPAELD